MAAFVRPSLLAALLLPDGARALNSPQWLLAARRSPRARTSNERHNASAPSTAASWVSPISGCQGFDCVLQYISLPDETYAWKDTQARLRGRAGGGRHGLANVSWTGYVLNMTSQTWRTGAQVNHPIWWHTLVVIVPDVVEFPDWATLTLDFGIHRADGTMDVINNRFATPEDEVELWIDSHNLNQSLHELKLAVYKAAFLAARTRAPAASLLNLPNGGEVFENDPVQMDRTQDYLKVFTYLDFLDHTDEPERIVDLPIAKAVVRAMDTVSAFTAGLPTGAVKRFGVTGYSKLGTATYVTAAADSRVKAIVPAAVGTSIRLDGLPSEVGPVAAGVLREMRRTYYKVNPSSVEAAYDFLTVGMPTPEFERLSAILSPLQFADRLTVPKLIVMGANDEAVEYWMRQVTDSWTSFPGPTAFLEVPNAAHDEVLPKSLGSSAAFFRGFLLGLTPPSVVSSWDPTQQTIGLTQAGNTAVQPVSWRRWDAPIQAPLSSESYTAELMQAPSKGGASSGPWSIAAASRPSYSSFVEVEFEWPEPGYRFKVSSREYPQTRA